MAKKTKDGFWMNELKLWGGAVKKVGEEMADSTRIVGMELMGAEPKNRKKSNKDRYGNKRYSNSRSSNRRYR